MSFDPNKITFFAKTDARGQNVPFGIKAIDRTRHMYVIGKTGMGKSTLLENMAVQDIQGGEGMAFIDPHGQTAETLLDYIPEERKDDVLYFAPFDTDNPVAFNVMEDVGPDRRHLVVSGLMSVFKKIWVDAWSARMEYILQNTLLALLEYPGSTLLGVNRMLSEKHYRKQVIDNISDPAVKSFWVDEFLNYNERYMQEAGDSIKNKIGQFTANPLIRNVIGQPKSSFDLRKIMDEKKILIMNLSKGLVGESNANLLGSMLTTRIYLAAMSRADVSVTEMKEMPNFYFYVDEFQSFANATFADILSEARKYKLNLTIAHQYIEQMEEEVRNAVFGNVGTICSFRVGPFDAETLETIYAPQFYAVDICNLGFAQIYLTLMIDGIGSKPFSAVTLPPIEQKSESCKQMVIHRSREQFAQSRAEVEQSINDWMLPVERPGGGKEGGGGGGGGKKPDFNNRNNDRKPYQGGGDRPPRRDNDRPAGDRPRPAPAAQRSESADRPRTEKPKPEKSLDDLRAVLQGLSKPADKKTIETARSDAAVSEKPKERPATQSSESSVRQKESAPKESTPKQSSAPVKEQSKDRPRTPAPTASEKPAPSATQNPVTPAVPAKPTTPAAASASEVSPVKQALADVLKDITKPSSAPRVTNPPAATTPSSSAAPTSAQQRPSKDRPQTPAPKQSPQTESRPSHKPAPSEPVVEKKPASTPQASAAPTPQAAPATTPDPLDPKKLERMMRVTTSDKSPLK